MVVLHEVREFARLAHLSLLDFLAAPGELRFSCSRPDSGSDHYSREVNACDYCC